jgi:hypothetical protein
MVVGGKGVPLSGPGVEGKSAIISGLAGTGADKSGLGAMGAISPGRVGIGRKPAATSGRRRAGLAAIAFGSTMYDSSSGGFDTPSVVAVTSTKKKKAKKKAKKQTKKKKTKKKAKK